MILRHYLTTLPCYQKVAAKKTAGVLGDDLALNAEQVSGVRAERELPVVWAVAKGSLKNKMILVPAALALLITVGVYGIVAGIVKLDDAGLYLLQHAGTDTKGKIQVAIGRGLLIFAPYLMKTLSIVGTAAMFLVGGGILIHGIPPVHHFQEIIIQSINALPGSDILLTIAPTILSAVIGILAGALVLLIVNGINRLRNAIQPLHS